ncbi:MAG: hypothetical protein AB7I34_27150, partial [Rhizobiaceae bacterium]
CGLDQQQRAKIFDLGSVTSEGGEVRGTIFTRAPELFVEGEEVHCDHASDIWALGASLLALRTGKYPFVHNSEVDERKNINEEMRAGKLSRDDAQKRKLILDEKVRERILASSAKDDLRRQVHESLRGRPEELLLQMLDFEKLERKTIRYFDKGWSGIAQELGGSRSQEKNGDSARSEKWQSIMDHVHLVERKELVLTAKQIDRIITEYRRDNIHDNDIERTLKKLAEGV